ncbi:MAG: phenylalanine--tRNA ligase subunit beta [Candidatus Sericytochromatia bacterium]|nr:phenylalanine--tRNA ligase subunit beta [Candidatus Sericytochromatia bacterium]
MQISLNWLADYVDVSDVSPKVLGDKLTLATAEVEGIETTGGDWPGVVAARILEIWQHPQADRIRMTRVDDGTEVLQVVCGAPNIEVGMIVPLAQIGATLPGDFKIKKSKIRGEDSSGMLCSAKELALTSESDGILVLPPETPLGTPLGQALGNQDTLYVIDNKSLTHRPDCWGHYGLAREVAAILKKPLQPLAVADLGAPSAATGWTVELADPGQSPRYSALLIDHVTVGPSPQWLQDRLVTVGSRPINLIVDLTNYVMLTVGEPLHAFDRAKLTGTTIQVRLAKAGETLRTLDGKDRELTPEMLVIADAKGPVALAGIMGGEGTEVAEGTTTLLVEAAAFAPAIIRRASTKLGLRTDAATRFEKSLDPAWTQDALGMFWHLLKTISPEATLVGTWLDAWPAPPAPVSVSLSTDYVRQRLGVALSDEAIIDILSRLQFDVQPIAGTPGTYTVGVPSFRATKDVGLVDDLVEEVGRVYGYDNITPTAPLVTVAPVPVDDHLELTRQLRQRLSGGLGFAEVYSYAFVDPADLAKLGMDPSRSLQLANPVAENQDRLRRSLLPNMLNIARDNWRHRTQFRLYELGTVFLKDEPEAPGLPTEEDHVLMLVAGKESPKGEMFFQAKGAVEQVITDLHLDAVQIQQASPVSLPSWAHPGRAAIVVQGNLELGVIFELHPQIAAAWDLPGATAIAVLYMPALLGAKRAKQTFQAPATYPQVPFDVSLYVPEREPVATVEAAIRQSDRKHIQDVALFDIYQGKNSPEGQKSVSYTVTFGAPDHTLSPDETQKLQDRVMRSLSARGYTVRQG